MSFGEGADEVTRGWDGRWIARTTKGRWIRAKHVIFATGGFHDAKTAPFAPRIADSVVQLHSKDYKRPSQLPDGAVLVVGTAQSGTQICDELCRAGKKVYLCVGSTSMRVPRRVRGVDFTWWLMKLGWCAAPRFAPRVDLHSDAEDIATREQV